MPKRVHAYLFVAYMLCGILNAQVLFSQSYYFKNYQVQQGLSGNTITSILQDRKGFMWFGTRNGLNRFDGTHFRIFSQDAENPASIGSNSILSLHEDVNETIWAGTYKGVFLYDAKTESFRPFTKIPRGEVRHIKGDSANTIWIISNFQLYKYNIATDDLRSYQANNMQSIALHVSVNGTVYVATTTGLVKIYNPDKDQFETHDIATINGQSITYIQDLHPINDSLLLIGTMNKVLLLNRRQQSIQNIFESSQHTGNIQVHSILRQSETSYWLGTETGIYIWELNHGIRNHIEKHFTNPYSISDNVINTFCTDREGGIWIGTFFGGVNYYSGSLSSFQKYSPISGDNKLSGNLVHEICRDDAGFIWIGTEDAGLNKLDPASGKVKHFMPGMGPGSIAYQNIHGLAVAGNELWIGTYEHGLDVMDLRTEKVIRHYKDGPGSTDLKGNFIVALHKTGRGEILVGTWNGLFKYNRKDDNFTQLPFFNTQIQAIYEDETGTIWACTYGNGVYYYNYKTDKGGRLLHDSLNQASIPNNYVNNLFEDSKKNIWFSTESGICQLNPKTGRIIRYTDGYLNNQTFRILEDSLQQYWISTAKGLVRLDPASRQTKQYNTANGLLSDQFNYNSAYRSPEGDMYFGTVKGMIRFKPETLPKNSFIPPVLITAIQINNQPRTFAATDNGSLVLPYDSSSISIDMAALSYMLPEMNEYAYKMEGIDKDWTFIKTNRRIYYTKLSPGNYNFLLKGSNSGEVWNEKITRLTITILPPFWASAWAYLIYVLAGFGIAGLIFRYYYLAWTEKNKRRLETMEMVKEREIYNAKIEFFTNVAHEIRTPLTMIKLPLDKILQMQTNNSLITESLLTMKKNTNRLIDLTDQLLDFRKAEANHFSLNFISTDITTLLKELVGGFRTIAEEKEISLKLEIPRISLQAYVDTEAFRKILLNLINNAIKYSKSTILVKLLPFNSEDAVFTIEISNDGYLIPADQKEKIFEPFYRLKETEKQPGTGIGLSLSRSLAELHKGVLELREPNGLLNIFQLTIPIHQENEINFLEDTSAEETITISAYSPLPVENSAKLHILLVEDNNEIAVFLQKELTANYFISRAKNGEEALDILAGENIQLVISDIMMPVMDGIELCRHIKTNIEYSHIPIILLTAKNTLNAKIEGLEVGADAYIEKPFDFEHLQAQISNLLNNRKIIREYFARSPITHLRGMASSRADIDFLERLNAAIEERITDHAMDVDQLCRLMNMSRTTLYRKIKAISDLTPNELINITRLKKAAELLASGNYKVNEVSDLVGYSLVSNFSRDFNKQFGMTPSAYINS